MSNISRNSRIARAISRDRKLEGKAKRKKIKEQFRSDEFFGGDDGDFGNNIQKKLMKRPLRPLSRKLV